MYIVLYFFDVYFVCWKYTKKNKVSTRKTLVLGNRWKCSPSSGGAREAAGSVRGVAVGGPEAGGMPGMLPVMSIPIFMGPGGPYRFYRW